MITIAALTDSTNLIGDATALRQRYHEDGVVYLRGVIDRDFAHPSAVHEALEQHICGHNMAKAAVEMGCWDVAARAQGVSLSRMLGGVHDRVPTGISIRLG